MSQNTKFFCIYTGKEWDESERSDEHIIAYSLGGSNQLVTRDVSKKGNNEIGSMADGALINSWFVAQERWRLKLKSQNGNIPPLDLGGTIEVNGKKTKAQYSIDHNHKIELLTVPEVNCDWSNGKIQILCDPQQLDGILANITKKADKKGLKLSAEKMKSLAGDVVTIENPEITINQNFDVFSFVPAFLKMALATGHHLFGYKWSKGTNADNIRKAMWESDRNKLIKYKIPGSVWPNSEFPAKQILDVGKDKHILVVANTGPLSFYAKLFGEFDGLIQLDPSVWNGPELAVGDFCILVVDPKSRSVTQYSFGDFLMLKNAGKL